MNIDTRTIASTHVSLEVMDVLYRFGAGVDHDEMKLLATAFQVNTTVDFGPCGHAMGLESRISPSPTRPGDAR